MNKILDCIIIGGGPAGLMAAIYLARYRRNFMIYDAGHSRAARIPLSHNYPGYQHGISGVSLLKKMRKQLENYSISVVNEEIVSLEKTETGEFIVTSTTDQKIARNILLAMGVEDIEPVLPNINQAIARGLIRHCPVCDGFEVIDKKVGVIGNGKGGLKEALFLRNYSANISLITLEKIYEWKKQERQKIKKAGIEIINEAVQNICLKPDNIKIEFRNGQQLVLDSLYSALGSISKIRLVAHFPLKYRNELLVVNKHQQTSIKGLYAAGDIVSNLHQICVAQSQAAIAATAIHNRCRVL